MYSLSAKHCLYVVFLGLLFVGRLSYALEFQPGVGVGAKYTDNAKLVPSNKAADVVAAGYVGASLSETDSLLNYGADASLRRERYVNGTFDEKRYLNLRTDARWEMLKERFDWFLSDDFSQSPFDSIDPDVPDNRQNRNTFVFGAKINQAIGNNKSFSLVPQFSQFYYELSPTNNKQYSLRANLNYKIYRTTAMGLSLAGRQINYDDISLSDTAFTNFAFILSEERARSNYTVNFGVVKVKRDAAFSAAGSTNSTENTGFTGSLNMKVDISSRSVMQALLLSEVTDTSTVSQVTSPGDPNNVQLAADVIRNSILEVNYSRVGSALHTKIWGEYRKIRYSDSTEFNSLIKTFGATLNFPVTQLVTSGATVKLDDIRRLEALPERIDKRFLVAANLAIRLSNKLSSFMTLQYRSNESTANANSYDELSFFVSLNYGLEGGGIYKAGQL